MNSWRASPRGGGIWLLLLCLALACCCACAQLSLSSSEGGEAQQLVRSTEGVGSQNSVTPSAEEAAGFPGFFLFVRSAEAGVSDFLSAVLQFSGLGEEKVWPRLELTPRLVVAVVMGAIGAALSSAGGVGGGGLYVPLFNLLVGFDSKTAAALSNFMIFGGSLGNLGINFLQLHPTVEGEPLIDFDAAMLLQPNMLLGISLGVICNVMFPAWLITALLAMTLFYITSRSLRGACKRWASETARAKERAQQLADASAVQDVEKSLLAPLLHNDGGGGGGLEETGTTGAVVCTKIDSVLLISAPEIDVTNLAKADVEAAAGTHGPRAPLTKALTLQKVIKTIGSGTAEEHGLHTPLPSPTGGGKPIHERFPLSKLAILAVAWFAFFAVQVLRGGKASKTILKLEPCGLGYWLLTVFQIPLAAGFTVWAASNSNKHMQTGSYLLKEMPVEPDDDMGTVNHGKQEEPASLSNKAGGLLPVMAFVAGTLGGMLGIGGGMIVNPLLLEIGMLPQVTAATCAFMVFFSSSMSVVQYWLLGRIPMQHALLFAGICLVFSFVGQIVVQRLIIRYGRASIIVFSVSIVIGLSAIAMSGFGGYDVWEQYRQGAYMGFHRPC